MGTYSIHSWRNPGLWEIQNLVTEPPEIHASSTAVAGEESSKSGTRALLYIGSEVINIISYSLEFVI